MTDEEAVELWGRAAGVGGLWAAAEITLGSFLHNVHVPFGGHLMTALGVCLMAAAYRRCPRPGLLWRSAMVCAALKSISPSAFILTPMIAISLEGLLMSGSVALLGGTPGLMAGGALAMLWTMVHPLIRIVVVYGWDAALVYQAAWGKTAAHLGVSADAWRLLAWVAAAHALGGAAAGSLGARVPPGAGLRAASARASSDPLPRRPFSSLRAAGNVAAMVALFVLALRRPLPVAAGAGILVVALWAWAYPLAARRLRRPGFWIGLGAMAVAAGVLLGRGAEPGARMVLRALVLTMGFAAVSQDLAGAFSSEGLERVGLARWADAVRAAFAALPSFIERMPSARRLLSEPADALAGLLDGLN